MELECLKVLEEAIAKAREEMDKKIQTKKVQGRAKK